MKVLSLLRRYFHLLLLAGISGWGAWYICTHSEELAAIQNISPGWLLLLFGLSATKLITMGAFTKVIVSCFGIELGFLEWFGLSAMSAMGNYLTPFRGGAAVRAVYLKSRHGLPYSSFLSTLSALYVLTFSTSAALGLLAALSLYLRFGLFESTLVVFFLFLLCLPIALFSLAKRIPPLAPRPEQPEAVDPSTIPTPWGKELFLRATSWLIEILGRIVEGWRIISAHRSTLVRLVFVSILNACVTLLMIHFSFAAFEVELPLLESLVLSSLFMVSSMIPITPSGLGVAEVAIVMASQGFVDDRSLSGLSAGLNRSVMIVSSIAWGVLFSYILGRRAAPTRDQEQAKETHANS